MHETINIQAFFDEACAKELSFIGLQVDQKEKDNDDQIVSLVRSRVLLVIERGHHFVHSAVDCDEFKDGTRNVAYILEFPKQFLK